MMAATHFALRRALMKIVNDVRRVQDYADVLDAGRRLLLVLLV